MLSNDWKRRIKVLSERLSKSKTPYVEGLSALSSFKTTIKEDAEIEKERNRPIVVETSTIEYVEPYYNESNNDDLARKIVDELIDTGIDASILFDK